MRILIVGGGGMLGHRLWMQLNSNLETWVTIRGKRSAYEQFNLFDSDRVIEEFDATNSTDLESAFATARPDIVFNCAAILNKVHDQSAALSALKINAVLPRELAILCTRSNSRLVHISTDGVFSGKRGGYTETDECDAIDTYGKTKSLGEVVAENCLVVRTCIIGHELRSSRSLLGWFLSQEGRTINGYAGAIFTGLSTNELSRVLESVISRKEQMSGIWHIAGKPISKYDFLCQAKEAFGWRGEILPENDFKCDRSLAVERFTRATRYLAPAWTQMLNELAANHKRGS